MAMANLDLQDLNALLKSYVNEYHELEKNIGDLQLINLLLIIVLLGILIYGLLFDPSMFVHHVVVTAK